MNRPVHKNYVRSIRDELGRYPNWPIQRSLSLGMVGLYNGREAAFDWITSLNKLGITADIPGSQSVISEMYTTADCVSFNFNAGVNENKAQFTFAKNKSVATQGYDLNYVQLQTGPLLKEILKKIKAGLIWNHDWLIITELWQANGFTALISGSSGSSTEISTEQPLSIPAFNIADVNLGLQVTKSTNMAYQGVAKQNVYPYFDVHKLIVDKAKGYYLKKYARNDSSVYFPRLDDLFED